MCVFKQWETIATLSAKEIQNIRVEGASQIALSSSIVWQMSKLRLTEGKRLPRVINPVTTEPEPEADQSCKLPP